MMVFDSHKEIEGVIKNNRKSTSKNADNNHINKHNEVNDNFITVQLNSTKKNDDNNSLGINKTTNEKCK